MKKRIFSMIAAVCILLTTAGCQNGGSENSAVTSPSASTSGESTESPIQSETTSTNSEYSSEPTEFSEEPENSVQQIKVSDMFTAPERRIWFKISSYGPPLTYRDPIYTIYVFEDDNITGYSHGYLALEDFDSMTDDEIIATAEKEYPDKYNCSVSFSYVPDATGNKLETEMINVNPIDFDLDIFATKEKRERYDDLCISGSIDNSFIEPTTILSKKYFGIKFKTTNYLLISQYNFNSPIEIILNEAGDEGIERE